VRHEVLGDQPAMLILKAACKKGDWKSLEKMGFDAYISKPFRLSKLAASLKTVCEGKTALCERHFVIKGGGTKVFSASHILVVEE